jgi:hypothetical protein
MVPKIETFEIEITQMQLEKLRGMGFTEPTGTLPDTQGIILAYATNFPMITFTIKTRPFYVPAAVIKHHMESLVLQL